MRGVAGLMCAVGALVLSGCWTFNRTEYPSTVVQKPKGEVSVSVIGFDATFIDYISIHGYQTHCGTAWYGGPYWGPYCETVPTTTYVPQARASDTFRHRAKDILEKAGYNVAVARPDWVVEVTFNGPYAANGSVATEWCWRLGTLFFCDYAATTWRAQLRVRNNATGKLAFSRDYDQPYETHAFGLIPLFGIMACDETTASFMQMWCLTALTDRTVADVATFLAAQPPPASR